jgi:hypothetical protein
MDVVVSAPDDHFIADPDRGVIGSASGCVRGAGRCPTIRYRLVSPAAVPVPVIAGRAHIPTPDDHLTPRPHGCVGISRRGSVGETGRCPTIRAWVVSATRVRVVERFIDAAPDNHLAAAPYRRVSDSAQRYVHEASRRPTVRSGIVSAARVQIGVVHDLISSTPNDHFAARPDCRVTPSGVGRVDRVGSRPAVRVGIVSPAAVEGAVTTTSVSTPDDHLRAGPHRAVILPCGRRVDGAGSCPSVGGWIVSVASVGFGGRGAAAPDDHFATGPHCSVTGPGGGRVGRARGYPTVGRGIVSRAGVQHDKVVAFPTPYNHFTAGPYCRVAVARVQLIHIAGSCPGVVDASANRRGRGCGCRCGRGCRTRYPRAVPPAGVQIAAAATPSPDDHLAAGPHCRVIDSTLGRASGASSCPRVGVGIVSSSVVEIVANGLV